MRYTSLIHFIWQRAVALVLPNKSGMDDIVRLLGVFRRLTFTPSAVEIAA